VWGAVPYYGEMMALIEAGMPAPETWSVADWRLGVRISRIIENQVLEEKQARGA
jgi:hypothetical protein